MKPMEEQTTLYACFKVSRVGFLVGRGLFKVTLECYAGTLFDLVLYTNGDEPCPFKIGDYYLTDDGVPGGWNLTRMPDEVNQKLREQDAEWEALSPHAKASRTREMHQMLAKYKQPN